MENKLITKLATAILTVINVGLFAYVWIEYYNKFAFQKFRNYGMVAFVIMFYICYRYLAKLYRAYDFASNTIWETTLSQFISLSLSDLLAYVLACIIANYYVSFVPGLIIYILQLTSSLAIVFITKKMLIALIVPLETLVIYGANISEDEVVDFTSKLLRKYSHMFNISKIVNENDSIIKNRMKDVKRVIFVGITRNKRNEFIKFCVETNQSFYFVPDIEDLLLRNCEIKHFIDTPIMHYDSFDDRKAFYVVKRAFDILASFMLLVILSPVMLVTAIAIKLDDGGPVFFKQERETINGRVFKVLKFRSMRVNAEENGFMPAVKDDDRITRVGKKIRKNRIDELPQLFNVLIGQMSLVGPRPERIAHVSVYEKKLPEFKYRKRVKSGITGYAQVYGKYNTNPEDKLKLDLIYIKDMSFILDIKLLLLTVKTVFIPEASEGFEKRKSDLIREAERKIG
ncbi:sugar transferase [Lachnospira multipara]|uniref:sugar transferase n=1 Tax=Lachnospira multipara TaxID=28051 RepID=UPI00068DB9CB|nr:sugar transferase [Lachnospira multipara]